jgi:hypothetical protein
VLGAWSVCCALQFPNATPTAQPHRGSERPSTHIPHISRQRTGGQGDARVGRASSSRYVRYAVAVRPPSDVACPTRTMQPRRSLTGVSFRRARNARATHKSHIAQANAALRGPWSVVTLNEDGLRAPRERLNRSLNRPGSNAQRMSRRPAAAGCSSDSCASRSIPIAVRSCLDRRARPSSRTSSPTCS